MDSLDKSIFFWLNYTTRNMRRYASEVLTHAGAGITVDQWGVLKLLDEHGGKMSNGRMTELMLKDRPTLTRIVDILCRERLVTRSTDQEDRRRLQVQLTSKGRKTITRVGPMVQAIRDEMSRGLSKKDLEVIRRKLVRINRRIDTLRGED
jgi:DNA-binding MarR family transcriptional regulator